MRELKPIQSARDESVNRASVYLMGALSSHVGEGNPVRRESVRLEPDPVPAEVAPHHDTFDFGGRRQMPGW